MNAGQISEKAKSTAARYYGPKAANYDANRVGQAKWEAEGRAVEAYLADQAPGTLILDCPCGTGRFITAAAHHGLRYLGIDASTEMVAQAEDRIFGFSGRLDPEMDAAQGSIFALDVPDNGVDVAICIRFANLIEPSDLILALMELQRVASREVLFNVRFGANDPKRYHDPQEIGTIERSLRAGWEIAWNRPIHEETYRLILLRHKHDGHGAADRGRAEIARRAVEVD